MEPARDAAPEQAASTDLRVVVPIQVAATTLVRLEAQFEQHYADDRGVIFVKAAQVVHRLNEVLGISNWTHTVLRDGYDEAVDELWVYGQLRGMVDGQPFVREAFGNQKVKRSSRSRDPLNWGDDRKAAQTDSLKKCAKQVGIAAYLDEPHELARVKAAMGRQAQAVQHGSNLVDPASGEVLGPVCEDCGKPLEVVKFSDSNQTWSVEEMARRSRNAFGGHVYDMPCYSKRRQAKARDAAPGRGGRWGGLPPEVGG